MGKGYTVAEAILACFCLRFNCQGCIRLTYWIIFVPGGEMLMIFNVWRRHTSVAVADFTKEFCDKQRFENTKSVIYWGVMSESSGSLCIWMIQMLPPPYPLGHHATWYTSCVPRSVRWMDITYCLGFSEI